MIGSRHEVVNINLSEKPDWYFDKNPVGTVPTLEFADKVTTPNSWLGTLRVRSQVASIDRVSVSDANNS